ncbi:ORF6N domain-containing protein [Roseibacillus persicicus]|uniref:ORF6N domain-containing protein n=1 Tax=Roseibacillus persicicus TaxID=454148 RepID=UPI00398BB22D
MSKNKELKKLEEKVVTFRDQNLLLDADLAKMLGTTTSSLLQMVGKNKSRFPKSFVFPAKKKELEVLIEAKHLTKKQANSRTTAPLLFTEAGAYMSAFLLKTKAADKLSVAVLDTFLEKEAKSAK